mmetsp:Transcript_90312/g.188854  ORF Transcript_90312/g.188854 Transcript_90312/m.188854 type:complete len:222 (+) Transcript_90312:426-1091(+)
MVWETGWKPSASSTMEVKICRSWAASLRTKSDASSEDPADRPRRSRYSSASSNRGKTVSTLCWSALCDLVVSSNFDVVRSELRWRPPKASERFESSPRFSMVAAFASFNPSRITSRCRFSSSLVRSIGPRGSKYCKAFCMSSGTHRSKHSNRRLSLVRSSCTASHCTKSWLTPVPPSCCCPCNLSVKALSGCTEVFEPLTLLAFRRASRAPTRSCSCTTNG